MGEERRLFDAEAEKTVAVRQTKRTLKILLWVLLLLLLMLAVVYPVAIAPLRNDLATERLLEALTENANLPSGAEIVETAAWAGNSTGTGNHVELWAGVLLYAPDTPAAGTSAAEWDKGAYWNLPDAGELFPTLAVMGDWKDYYIYETFADAVTQWDIRGH